MLRRLTEVRWDEQLSALIVGALIAVICSHLIMNHLQHAFPALPPDANNHVPEAYTRVKEIYDRGVRYLAQEEPDPLRVRITADQLMDLDDLMDAMVQEIADDGWAGQLSQSIVAMDIALRETAERMSAQYVI